MTANILIVEELPGEGQRLADAFKQLGVPVEVDIASDGKDGLDRLLAQIAKHHLPDLIILSNNLPRLSGGQLLTLIRASISTQAIPVVMLGTSTDDLLINRDQRATICLTKSAEADDALSLVQQMIGLLPQRPVVDGSLR